MDDVSELDPAPASAGPASPVGEPDGGAPRVARDEGRAEPAGTPSWPPPPGWGAHPVPPAPPRSRFRRLLGPATAALGVVAAVSYVGSVDPNRPGNYPACPFLSVTGWFCPGCGGLRCVHALAHADIPAALAFNGFAVVMVPLVAWIWLRWTVRAARGRARVSVADPRLIRVLVGAIVVFTVVRNLPFGGALAP